MLSGSDLKQALTPGTALMHRLRGSLLFWAESKLARAVEAREQLANRGFGNGGSGKHGLDNGGGGFRGGGGGGGGGVGQAVDFGELQFYVTGSDVPGEGEMKLLAELYHQARLCTCCDLLFLAVFVAVSCLRAFDVRLLTMVLL